MLGVRRYQGGSMAQYVTKASGERELFSSAKFQRSLLRAGAPNDIVEELMHEIMGRPDLDTTEKIYSYAYAKLRDRNSSLAARYSLKNALYEFGPEGFLFERFMAALFKAQGYATSVDQTISGVCVDHEIDIVLEKGNQRWMAECKFHNTRGIKTDVKVALYVKARFLDLSDRVNRSTEPEIPFDGVWLMTNTQLTTDAIQYGTCAGMHMLAWGYPEEGNIAQLIETLGLHPITSITYLTAHQKRYLLERNILFARDLIGRVDLYKELNIDESMVGAIEAECHALGLKLV